MTSATVQHGSPFRAILVPMVGWQISAPEPLMNSRSFLAIHRRASKVALRTTLLLHKATRLREHFKQTNRAKYDHKPRKSVTKNIKKAKYGSITDLVMSGRTKEKMLGEFPRIQIGGSADSVLRGRMFLRFPFPVDLDVREADRVTPADMAEEIARWTAAEVAEAAGQYGEFYVHELEAELAARPRLHRRLGPQLQSLRGSL